MQLIENKYYIYKKEGGCKPPQLHPPIIQATIP
jgi:hypothetical protein